MIIRNGKIFTENAGFVAADLEIENGRIAKVAPAGIHIHGAAGATSATAWTAARSTSWP